MNNQFNSFSVGLANLTSKDTSSDLVEFCKRWVESNGPRMSMADVELLLHETLLPGYTLGHLFLLQLKLGKTSDAQFSRFLPVVNNFLALCDVNQILWAPSVYQQFFAQITNVAIQNNLPMCAISLLRNAILKLTGGSSGHMTNLHAPLFALCLKARHFHAALPFFKLDVVGMFSSGTMLEYGDKQLHFVMTSPLKHPLAASNNIAKLALDEKEVLLYFYYGGLILCALERFEEGALFFEHAICLPAMKLSAIVLESFKKYILVSLILGRANPFAHLPHYKSSAIQRMAIPLSIVYMDLVKMVKKNCDAKQDVVGAIQYYLMRNADTFNRDGNTGLMKRLILSSKERAIVRLEKLFMSVNVGDATRRSFLANDDETVNTCRRLSYRDQITAKFCGKAKTLTFGSTGQKPMLSEQDMGIALHELSELSKGIRSFEELVRLHPIYISKHKMSGTGKSEGPHDDDDGVHVENPTLAMD